MNVAMRIHTSRLIAALGRINEVVDGRNEDGESNGQALDRVHHWLRWTPRPQAKEQ